MIGATDSSPRPSPWRAERILYDRAGLLVVDKPPGLVVHGGREDLRHSVVDRLQDWLEQGGRPGYLGVHQRLDEGTSGLLFFTTERDANAAIAAAMEQRQVMRRYLAVVPWTSPGLADRGTVEVELRFDGKTSRVVPLGGKQAVTHYRLLERRNTAAGPRALLELDLDTGRPHQIRASLAHLGVPVVGDARYGGEPAQRLMLHAHHLSGPAFETELESPLPDALASSLAGNDFAFPRAIASPLADALTRRAPLLDGTQAYRLVNGEGDGLPGITIDVYGAACVLNLYDEALDSRVTELAEALGQLGFQRVYLKRRLKADVRGRDKGELVPETPVYVASDAPQTAARLIVLEHGLRVPVDLADGLSTGLFVDQRDNHFRSRSWARAGRVLNLFCYTSVFSASAALSGAMTTNVDLSGRALSRSRELFEENGLDPASHRFIREDALKYLERAVRRGERFDFIVLDPPSFATVGRGTFTMKGKYLQAATACLQLLNSRGRLLAVTNHTKTSPSALKKMLQQAAERAERPLRGLKILPSGLDCPATSQGPWPSKSALVEVE